MSPSERREMIRRENTDLSLTITPTGFIGFHITQILSRVEMKVFILARHIAPALRYCLKT